MSSSDGLSIAITTASHDADGDIIDEGVTYSTSVCHSSFFYLSDGISVSSSLIEHGELKYSHFSAEIDTATAIEITVSSTASAENQDGSSIDPNDTTCNFSTTITSASQTMDMVEGSNDFCSSEESNANGNICGW